MCFACWTPEPKNGQSNYVVIFAFPLQQWFDVCASSLHYTYITCLVHSFDGFSTSSVCQSRVLQDDYWISGRNVDGRISGATLSRNRGIPRKKRLVLRMYELTIRAGDQWSMNQGVTRPNDCLEDTCLRVLYFTRWSGQLFYWNTLFCSFKYFLIISSVTVLSVFVECLLYATREMFCTYFLTVINLKWKRNTNIKWHFLAWVIRPDASWCYGKTRSYTPTHIFNMMAFCISFLDKKTIKQVLRAKVLSKLFHVQVSVLLKRKIQSK